jgi:hypothetical protein
LTRRERRNDPAEGVASGAFLILVAVFYLTNPNLLAEARAFVYDFKLVEISQNFWWFAPSTNHPVLYSAAAQFCYVFAIVQVAVLVLSFLRKSSLRGKAKTASDIIFWLGVGYAFGYLASGELLWLSFLGALIIFLGVAIVVRSAILMFAARQ